MKKLLATLLMAIVASLSAFAISDSASRFVNEYNAQAQQQGHPAAASIEENNIVILLSMPLSSADLPAEAIPMIKGSLIGQLKGLFPPELLVDFEKENTNIVFRLATTDKAKIDINISPLELK